MKVQLRINDVIVLEEDFADPGKKSGTVSSGIEIDKGYMIKVSVLGPHCQGCGRRPQE